MLKVLDRINPDVDTIIICTDVPLLRYYIQTKLEKFFNVTKNYSVTAETGVLFKKAKSDALVAPLEGDKWLIMANIDKIGVDTTLAYLNHGNANGITLLYTDKYMNYKKIVGSDKYKEVKVTVLTLYLGRFDIDDISYLHKDMVVNSPQGKPLTDDLLNYLCKNYRYDVARVMDLFSKMKIGLEIKTKQDLIDEVGLGGMTPASFTLDLLRVFQVTNSRYAAYAKNSITDKRIANATKKYLGYLHDLSGKLDYRTIYNQMHNTLKGILDIKMLILNGKYRKNTKDIPEGYSQQAVRIKSLQRFDGVIREDISINRVLMLLDIMNKSSVTFDYEFKLMEIICKFIAVWECATDDSKT